MAKKRSLGAPNSAKASNQREEVWKSSRLRNAGMCASIFAAVFLAYFPAIQGTLLWDDSSHITKPQSQSVSGLWRIWTDLTATQQYYPLLHSAFWMEHRIWGDAVAGYHLLNILLHAAAACLVAMIVRRLALPGAWLAAFVFALHPVCVEAVAWISEQKSTLSAVFYLASALIYLRFYGERKRSQYFAAAGLFVLAVLTKTVTATLPAALLVVMWWKNGRPAWRRDVLPLLPWLAFGIAAGVFTAWVEWKFIGAKGADFELTFLERTLLAGRIVWFYAAKVVWPFDLIFTYPRWQIDAHEWWQYSFPIALVAAVAGLWFLARRNRGPIAAALFFCGTLVPVLGFLNVYPFRFSYVADHFQYLASLGIIIPASSGLVLVLRRFSSLHKFVPAALVALLAVLTWRQSSIYSNEETLYRATLERNTESWMAHHNLAKALAEKPGHLQEAIGEYQASLRIYPDFAETHNNLGNVLAQIPGRLDEARRELEISLKLNPDYVNAHYNLANLLSRIPGKLPEAVAEYQAAIRLKPDFAEAHHNLAIELSQMPDRLPDAIREYQAALALNPAMAEAHNDLCRALAAMPARMEEALAECNTAIRLNAHFPSAYNNMGNILSQMPERLPDAIAAYHHALEIAPDDAEAHNNLGTALAQSGRLSEAVAEFRIALRIDPEYADARANLESALLLSEHPIIAHPR
jgi:tetratricopeptide (TPR) repeat protein